MRRSVPDSVGLLRQDLINQAKTLTEIVNEQRKQGNDIQTLLQDKAARTERDIRWEERFENTNKGVNELRGAGKWVLGAIGSVVLIAIANFIVNGGLSTANAIP